MAERLGNEQAVTVEELALSNRFESAAPVAVLERKGLLNRQETVAKIVKMRTS